MSRSIALELVKITTNETRSIDIFVTFDSGTIEIPDENIVFTEKNLYQSFMSFNAWLQNKGWIPLCNGARIDAAISGLALDSLGGSSVYLYKERDASGLPVLADIFGKTTAAKVGTIKQQEEFFSENFPTKKHSESNNAQSLLLERYHGCLCGLACGDAVGTSVEFKKRNSFPELKDMIGGGPFNLLPGQWTDDTSMALCLAESLTRELKEGETAFDARDQLQRYLRWKNEGYYSSTGRCFDIGNTVSKALNKFEVTGNPDSGPTDPRSAGNGSIMRLAPVALYYFNCPDETAKYAELSSKTTHGAQEAVDACHIFSLMLNAALAGKSKHDILFDTPPKKILTDKIEHIRQGSYQDKPIDQINGSGYVVDSLEAALWCFYTTDNFRDAILRAANLGDDSDTTAAVCGQIAGAHYGISHIPKEWIYKLAKRDAILDLSKKLYSSSKIR